MAKNDGGPAFPTASATASDDERTVVFSGTDLGMSLRDWLTGMALSNPAICTGTATENELRRWFGERAGITKSDIVAEQAHSAAAAVLATREKSDG